jgi:hypothetical protein
MIDQAVIGGLLTGGLALASQFLAKIRCYTACKRDPEGEFCEPQCQFGFMDTTLESLEKISEESKE